MNKEHGIDWTVCLLPGVSAKEGVKSLLWLAIATLVYLAALFGLQHNPQWSPGWKSAVELSALLPGAFYISSLLRSFRTMDELQRRIQIEALIFALAGTVGLSTVLNVLNANGVGIASYPHGLEIGGAYMSMFLLWSIGVTLSARRYR